MLRTFFGRELGQASLEYVLIFTLVVIFLVGGLVLMVLAGPVFIR